MVCKIYRRLHDRRHQTTQLMRYPRVRNCDSLVANATKDWVLATRILKLVASRRLTFCPFGIWNSKVKRLFLKENIKLSWTIVLKRSDDSTIAIFTRRHIDSAASPITDTAGENVAWRNRFCSVSAKNRSFSCTLSWIYKRAHICLIHRT